MAENQNQNKEFETCSWYQTIPETSLELIAALHLPKEAAILDVGGGESHLTAFLLKEGFYSLLIGEIQLCMSTGNNIGKAFNLKVSDNGGTHHTPMACYINF